MARMAEVISTVNPIGADDDEELGEPGADPTAAAPSKSKRRAELEAALTGLKDGSLSEQQAAAVIDDTMARQIEDLRAELSTPISTGVSNNILGPVIQSVFAHMTEAPTNWHQAMVFFAASDDPEDAEMVTRLPLMLLVSLVMVGAQCATVVAVLVGTFTPACLTNDQCFAGNYCSVGFTNRCQYCGSHAPVIIHYGEDGKTYNNVYDRNFAGFNRTYVEELCNDPVFVP